MNNFCFVHSFSCIAREAYFFCEFFGKDVISLCWYQPCQFDFLLYCLFLSSDSNYHKNVWTQRQSKNALNKKSWEQVVWFKVKIMFPILNLERIAKPTKDMPLLYIFDGPAEVIIFEDEAISIIHVS